MSSMSPISPSQRLAPWCGQRASVAKMAPPKRKKAINRPWTRACVPGLEVIRIKASVCAARTARWSGSLGCLANVRRGRLAVEGSAPGVGVSLVLRWRLRRWTVTCEDFTASRKVCCHSSPSGMSYALSPVEHQNKPVASSQIGGSSRAGDAGQDGELGTRWGDLSNCSVLLPAVLPPPVALQTETARSKSKSSSPGRSPPAKQSEKKPGPEGLPQRYRTCTSASLNARPQMATSET
mmetsp:Transcript_16084/g.56014  ORF Transcript_16084/g.56014 Transcript_16084/m.56014 type:complete len:237 (-) Transcript_16084:730-1440(-)